MQRKSLHDNDLEAILGGLKGYLGLFWGHLGAAWGHLGAILGGCGGYLGPSWTILGLCWENLVITWAQGSVLEMPNRFRSAPVQRKRLHDITQVHTEQRQVWKTLILLWFYKLF